MRKATFILLLFVTLLPLYSPSQINMGRSKRDTSRTISQKPKHPPVFRDSSIYIPDMRALQSGWKFKTLSGWKKGEFIIDSIDIGTGRKLFIREIIIYPRRKLSDTEESIIPDSILRMQRLKSNEDFSGVDSLPSTWKVHAHATYEIYDFSDKSLNDKLQIIDSIIKKNKSR